MRRALWIGLVVVLGSSLSMAGDTLKAKVMQIVPTKNGVEVTLNKGSVFGVKEGSQVIFDSKVQSVITEAKKFRSKTEVNLAYDRATTYRYVTIKK